MLKKSFLLAMLLLTLALTATAIKADELPADSMARYLRPDAYLYVEVRDLAATIERAKGLAITKLIQNPEIQALINSLKDIARDEGEGEQIDALEELLTKAMKGFSGQFTIAMPSVSVDDTNPKLILTSNFVQENKALIEDLFKQLKDIIFERHDVEFAESVVQLDEQAVHMFKHRAEDDDALSVCYTLTDKLAIMTIGLNTMKIFLADMLAPPAQSLANNPRFVKTYNAVHSQDLFWYNDNRQAVSLTEGIFATIRTLPVVGEMLYKFKDFTACIGNGISIEGTDFVEESISLFNEPDNIFARALASGNTEMKTAKLMPTDCLFYMSFCIPTENRGELFDEMIGQNKLPDNFKNFENNMMLSLRDDLLPALGGEIGLYLSMQFFMPEFLLAVELKDPNMIRAALPGLDVLLPGGITESVFREHTIYSMAGAAMAGMQLAATVKDNYLLIGLISAIKSAIVREENLTENVKFIQTCEKVKQAKNSFMLFIDVENLMGFVYDNAMPYIQSALATFEQFDPTTIPTRNALIENLRPFAASSCYSGDSIKSKSTGFVSLSMISLFQVLYLGMRVSPDEVKVPEDVPPDLF